MLSSAPKDRSRPAEMREKFGIKPGDRVGFVEENGRLIIQPHPQGVAAAFGILKARKSVSLSAMDETIKVKRKNPAGA